MTDMTEVLYPGVENYNSEDYKLTRIARHARGQRIDPKTPDAHIAVVGLLGYNLMTMTHRQMEAQRSAMKDTLWRVREKLKGIGLDEEGIVVYVPFKITLNRDGLVVLYSLETAPRKTGPYMWGREPKIQPSVTPQIEATLNMVYDLKARDEEEKRKGENPVECEVEVTIWNDKNHKKKIDALSEMKLVLSVERHGVIKEVGGELTALKAKLDEVLPRALRSESIQKIEISLKGEATAEFAHDPATFQTRFKEWQGKVKLMLSADLRIPVVKLKLPIEISGYVDQDGKPGLEVLVKVVEW